MAKPVIVVQNVVEFGTVATTEPVIMTGAIAGVVDDKTVVAVDIVVAITAADAFPAPAVVADSVVAADVVVGDCVVDGGGLVGGGAVDVWEQVGTEAAVTVRFTNIGYALFNVFVQPKRFMLERLLTVWLQNPCAF